MQISAEFTKSYHDMIESGEKHISGKKIAILGIARDVEGAIEPLIRNLSMLNTEDHPCTLSAFIYENDSKDKTEKTLKYLHKNPNKLKSFNYVSEKLDTKRFGQTRENERTTNLAACRNKCLEYAKKHYSDYDYIIVVDTDLQAISIEGIINSFGWLDRYQETCYGMVGHSLQRHQQDNGKEIITNYDSWAYRHTWWNELGLTGAFPYDPMLWFRYWLPVVGSTPLPVNSAFGAVGIYRAKYYLEGKYSGEDCEHVTFHYSIKQKYPEMFLYLNHSQLAMVN